MEEALAWGKEKGLEFNKELIEQYKKNSEELKRITLEYKPPVSINVVGGYALKACITPKCADMIVEMDPSLVKEKDHVNFRYFLKKGYYLAFMSACLLDAKDKLPAFELSWELMNHTKYSPVAVLRFADEIGSMRILPFTKSFKPYRLSHARSSIRPSFYNEQLEAVIPISSEEQPSPLINSCILSEVMYGEHLKVALMCSRKIPAFSESVKLGKAWLRQRCYSSVIGSINGFHLTMIMCMLASNGTIDASMDEMQIWKLVLKFLSSEELQNGCTMAQSQPEVPEEYKSDFTLESFKKSFDCAFIDPSGLLNIFWNVSRTFLKILQADAARHYNLIAKNPNYAKLLLLEPDEIDLKYDITLTVPVLKELGPDVVDPVFSFAKKCENILLKALTDRVDQLVFSRSSDTLTVGIILNPENCFRLVDLGPSVDDKAGCNLFRQFWGTKSELRRFKDSSIKEAAVWEEHAKTRHMVVPAICKFILDTHLGIKDVEVICDQLDFATEQGTFSPVISAFEELTKIIRSQIKTLPLTILGVEPVGPSLRYSSLHIPKPLDSVKLSPSKLGPTLPVHKAIVRVEGSGKWPQDPHASELLKQAFLLQLTRLLSAEAHLQASFAKDFLDVACEGFVFRLYLTFNGELQLLKRHGLESSEALERLTITLPKHARAIHGLHTGNVVFGPSVRLAKQFISSQLLMHTVIAEELVELLMAHVFTENGKFDAPHSSWTGFLRFIHLLATFDFEAGPLVVQFDHHSIVEPSTYDRENYCLAVFASYDEGKVSTWSISSENKACLVELRKLCLAALKHLKTNPASNHELLFKRSLSKAFSGVLNLSTSNLVLTKPSQLAIKTASLQADFLRYLPGFSPAKVLLADLEKNFGKHAQFFYDGKETICYRSRTEQLDDGAIRKFCGVLLKD